MSINALEPISAQLQPLAINHKKENICVMNVGEIIVKKIILKLFMIL